MRYRSHTTHPPITKRSFELLAQLARNNNREWFLDHKAEFEVEVRDAFAGLLERCTEAISDTALPFRGGKASMFRAYRDVRFSKDKSPYSLHVSGMLTPNGTRKEARMIYIQMKPGKSFIASGHYGLGAKQLEPIRRRMVEDPTRWNRALDRLNDHGLSLSLDDTLKSMARGFSDFAEHQMADYIRLKTLIAREDIADAEFIDGTVVKRVVNMAEAVPSLLDFRV